MLFSYENNAIPFSGNLRSIDVLRSLYEALCEFFLNKLRKYGGASPFKLLKTIVLDSMSTQCLNLNVDFSRSRLSNSYWGEG